MFEKRPFLKSSSVHNVRYVNCFAIGRSLLKQVPLIGQYETMYILGKKIDPYSYMLNKLVTISKTVTYQT